MDGGYDRARPWSRELAENRAATAVPGKHTLVEQRYGDSPSHAAPRANHTSARPADRLLSRGESSTVQALFGLPAAVVQQRASGSAGGAPDAAAVHASARRGIASSAGELPHRDAIQRAFGRHDISSIRAHTGPEATATAREMGAEAYATGAHVVLGDRRDLFTAAHEAAHVVQQRGGVALKSGVGAAGDRYEQHADAVAELVVQGKSAEALLDQYADKPAGPDSGEPAVQRKVGLEIEMPSFHLDKGVMKPQDKGKKETKGKKGKEKPISENSGLLSFSNRGLLSLDEDDEDPFAYGSMSQALYDHVDEEIKKGDPIVSGDGWKLTADIVGGATIVEFITEAPDETKEADRLPQIVGGIKTYVNTEMASLQGCKQLPKQTVLKRVGPGLTGNIQITGGIRPDRIIQLLEAMSRWKGQDSDLKVDKSSRKLLGHAVRSAKESSNDPSYQGLVALLGGYVGGNWRIQEIIGQGYEQLRERRKERKWYKIAYCVSAKEIDEYFRTGKITDNESLEYIQKQYEGDQRAFAKDMRAMFTEFMAPRAAKMRVPVLSRSSLAELMSKTQIQDPNQFKAHVMAAAGVPLELLDQRLFPFGLDTPGHDRRSIEATPNITIKQWLDSILRGQNLTFSDETKSFEDVGPGTPYCCIFESREQGAVLEIRALDGKQLVPIARWVPLAETVVKAYQQLNEHDD